MTLGPLMIDIAGYELTAEDKKILSHPLVGGVILFARNYKDIDQLQRLITAIKQIRDPQLVIAVDHEGGRVQRFREGFTRIPAMRKFGEIFHENKLSALSLTEQCGWILAAELLAIGIDFSFTPVLDLDYGVSEVIGDRSFNADNKVVAELATALMTGMQHAGMSAVAKHYPGHGAVVADSHVDIPVDDRDFNTIEQNDIAPFIDLIKQNVAGIMPAHVIYSQVDKKPAGFSDIWLKQLLRQKYHFNGVIFSDDLIMAGASIIGDYIERAHQALLAGCDILLVCNNRDAVKTILDNFSPIFDANKLQRCWELMRGKSDITNATLQQSIKWNEIHHQLQKLDESSRVIEEAK